MYQVRRTIGLLLLALMLAPTAVQAAVLDGFYQVEIPAREGQDRSQALREAFELMITRQAGSDAVDSEAVLAAMQDPRAYMRRIAGTEAGGVRVEFEPASLRDLLTEAGLPLLGPNRPAVMLWAAEENALGAELLSQSSDWITVLNEAARHRAVALSLPLADLEDRTLVDVANIQQADADTLKRASERYDASAVLALTISEAAGEPVLDWTWWLNEESEGGRITGPSKAAVADELMGKVADLVLAQYAVTPAVASETSRWQLVVDGVNSLDEFAGLQRTLQQLGSQQMPRVLSIKGEQVRLEVNFPGTESQLERLLALDQRLRRMPAPEPESVPETPSEAQPVTAEEPPAEQEASGMDSDGSEIVEAASQEPAEEAPADLQPEPEPAPNMMYFRWR